MERTKEHQEILEELYGLIKLWKYPGCTEASRKLREAIDNIQALALEEFYNPAGQIIVSVFLNRHKTWYYLTDFGAAKRMLNSIKNSMKHYNETRA